MITRQTILTFTIVLLLSTGCMESLERNPTKLDALIDATASLTIANTASIPVNPYAVPVGVGLAGITAMLEALRRKERAGRKHAENRLNGNGDTK